MQQSVGPTIVMENKSSATGVASFVFGIISIFILAPIFVPLAVLLGIIALLNKQVTWGILGIFCASIGFATSPILMSLSIVAALSSKIPKHQNTVQQSQYSISQNPMSATQLRLDKIKQAKKETAAALTECRNKRLSGEFKTYVESANCSNPKIIDAYQNADYPYMDLIGLLVAKRLEVSEKIDSGKETPGQGELEAAQFIVKINELERSRSSR